jgi:hypothetical protein
MPHLGGGHMPSSQQGPRADTRKPGILGVVFFLFLGWAPAVRAQHVPTVTVVGLDYAYQAPAILPAGRTTFAFENRGKVWHEVVIARLKAGVTVDSLMHAEAGPARRALVKNAGILVAEPGESPLGRLVVDLSAGETYVLYCNFQDTPDKPRHMTMGMVAIVHVK